MRAKPYLDRITPYIGGKSKAAGHARPVKLSSNENPYGPSPRALAAYRAGEATLHRYPEDGALSLREAIARAHGLKAEQIICGAGSDEVIGMLVHAYAGEGDEVLYSAHGFLMYRIYAEQFGATPVAAPETDLTADVDALLAAVSPRTRLLFLANPNNPTGSYLPASALHRLRAGLREDIILVIDGAYHEYVTAADYSDGRELIDAGTNTVITRTFSKIYGLPALRLGWGYGPLAIVESLYKVRSPFNVTQPAIAAALAALADTAYLQDCARRNASERERLAQALTRLGLHVYPSEGNFLLARCPDAAALNGALLARGIIVREVANYGLPDCLRITVGTEEENDMLLAALKEMTGAE